MRSPYYRLLEEDKTMRLTEAEENRYNRHLILDQIGREGQLKLKNAKILVVGAGGLGCPALQYLTAAGVGTLGIVDFDEVDLSNLHRQILFNHQDVGRNKASCAAEKLHLLNPEIELIPYPVKLEASNAKEIIANYDIVLDGSDNFATRYLVNDCCTALNKPMVYGAIYKFEGQVSVFNYNNGPTYRCLFPENDATAPNCSEVGVLGVLPGVIGLYQATEAIKIILDIGQVLSGRLLQMNLLTHETTQLSIQKRKQQTQTAHK
jgi:adenylyltransferase/sulfurtransferase